MRPIDIVSRAGTVYLLLLRCRCSRPCLVFLFILVSLSGMSQNFPLFRNNYFMGLYENPIEGYGKVSRTSIQLNYKYIGDTLAKGNIYNVGFKLPINRRLHLGADYNYLDVNQNISHYALAEVGYLFEFGGDHSISLGSGLGLNKTTVGGDPGIHEQTFFFRVGGVYHFRSLNFSFYTPYLANKSRLNLMNEKRVGSSISDAFVAQLRYRLFPYSIISVEPSMIIEKDSSSTTLMPQLSLHYKNLLQLGVNYRPKKESVFHLGLAINGNVNIDFSYLVGISEKRGNSLEAGLRIMLGNRDRVEKTLGKSPVDSTAILSEPALVEKVEVDKEYDIILGRFNTMAEAREFKSKNSNAQKVDTSVYIQFKEENYYVRYSGIQLSKDFNEVTRILDSLRSSQKPVYANSWIMTNPHLKRVSNSSSADGTMIDVNDLSKKNREPVPNKIFIAKAKQYADQHNLIVSESYLDIMDRLNPNKANLRISDKLNGPSFSKVKWNVKRSVNRQYRMDNKRNRKATDSLRIAIDIYQKQVVLFKKLRPKIIDNTNSKSPVLTQLQELSEQLHSAEKNMKVKKVLAEFLTHSLQLLSKEIHNTISKKEVTPVEVDLILSIRKEIIQFIELRPTASKVGTNSFLKDYMVGSLDTKTLVDRYPDQKSSYQFSNKGSMKFSINVFLVDTVKNLSIEAKEKYKIHFACPVDSILNDWSRIHDPASATETTLFPVTYCFRVVDLVNETKVRHAETVNLNVPSKNRYTITLRVVTSIP